MFPRLTRRDFLSDAAMAGVASVLNLDASASKAHEESSVRRAYFDNGGFSCSVIPKAHTWRTFMTKLGAV
jgi:hypothetical protein